MDAPTGPTATTQAESDSDPTLEPTPTTHEILYGSTKPTTIDSAPCAATSSTSRRSSLQRRPNLMDRTPRRRNVAVEADVKSGPLSPIALMVFMIGWMVALPRAATDNYIAVIAFTFFALLSCVHLIHRISLGLFRTALSDDGPHSRSPTTKSWWPVAVRSVVVDRSPAKKWPQVQTVAEVMALRLARRTQEAPPESLPSEPPCDLDVTAAIDEDTDPCIVELDPIHVSLVSRAGAGAKVGETHRHTVLHELSVVTRRLKSTEASGSEEDEARAPLTPPESTLIALDHVLTGMDDRMSSTSEASSTSDTVADDGKNTSLVTPVDEQAAPPPHAGAQGTVEDQIVAPSSARPEASPPPRLHHSESFKQAAVATQPITRNGDAVDAISVECPLCFVQLRFPVPQAGAGDEHGCVRVGCKGCGARLCVRVSCAGLWMQGLRCPPARGCQLCARVE